MSSTSFFFENVYRSVVLSKLDRLRFSLLLNRRQHPLYGFQHLPILREPKHLRINMHMIILATDIHDDIPVRVLDRYRFSTFLPFQVREHASNNDTRRANDDADFCQKLLCILHLLRVIKEIANCLPNGLDQLEVNIEAFVLEVRGHDDLYACMVAV